MAFKRDEGVVATLPDGKTKMDGTIWYFIDGKAWVSLKFALTGCSPLIPFELTALEHSDKKNCPASGPIPPGASEESPPATRAPSSRSAASRAPSSRSAASRSAASRPRRKRRPENG